MTDLNALTQERLKYLLRYDMNTGEFFWIRGRGPVAKPETKAGCTHPNGYTMIKVDGVNYAAHHLAWLYVTGAWAAEEVDHKNTVRSDNSFENLREATHAQNQQNSGIQKNNLSGYKGVSFHSATRRWRAGIGSNNRRYHLGYFESAEAAYEVYKAKAIELHGEFARLA